MLENFGIGCRAWVARLDIALLFAVRLPEATYHALPRFPASTRDLAVICDESLPVAAIEKTITGAVGNILEQIKLFDVYRGAPVPAGKKRASPIPWCCVPPTAPSPWRNAIRPSKKSAQGALAVWYHPARLKFIKQGENSFLCAFSPCIPPALYATIVLVHHLGPPAHPAGAPYAAPGRPQLCTEGRVTIWPIPNPPSLFPSRKTGKRN